MAKIVASKIYSVVTFKNDGTKIETGQCLSFMKGCFGRRFVKGYISTAEQELEYNEWIYNGILPSDAKKYEYNK